MSLIALTLCDINDVDTTINQTLNAHPSLYALLEPVIPHAAEFREGALRAITSKESPNADVLL